MANGSSNLRAWLVRLGVLALGLLGIVAVALLHRFAHLGLGLTLGLEYAAITCVVWGLNGFVLRTLLAFLVGEAKPCDPVDFPWMHPQQDAFGATIREQLFHARGFSDDDKRGLVAFLKALNGPGPEPRLLARP